MVDINDYADLDGLGYEGHTQTSPENEFFHAVYITGNSRKNEIGITEESGKLQIRGVDYNKDKVCMIITHVKQILSKETKDPTGNMRTTCFSFKKGAPPWHGWNGRTCGTTAAERASSDFCKPCKAQILVAGLYCNESGKPILGEDGKPTFLFLRGKGMKYKNIGDYLSDLSNKDLTPILKPVTEQTKRFEKANVNNKRFVTEVTIGEADSRYGIKKVFDLKTGIELPENVVVDMLNITKKTVDKFTDKFEWKDSSSRYTPTAAPQDEDPYGHKIPDSTPENNTSEPKKTNEESSQSQTEDAFDFDSLEI